MWWLLAVTTDDIFTVRNTNGTTTFELFQADGTTASNVTSFSSASVKHGLAIVSDVNGTFVAGETITGGTSGVTDVLQSDVVGLKAQHLLNLHKLNKLVWQVHNLWRYFIRRNKRWKFSIKWFNNVASNVLTGFGTRFNDELKIGDSISFTNDAGTTEIN